jgi:hypothetical protein
MWNNAADMFEYHSITSHTKQALYEQTQCTPEQAMEYAKAVYRSNNDNLKLLDLSCSFDEINTRNTLLTVNATKVALEFVFVVFFFMQLKQDLDQNIFFIIVGIFALCDFIFSFVCLDVDEKHLINVAILKKIRPDYTGQLLTKNSPLYKIYSEVVEKEREARKKQDLMVEEAFKKGTLYSCLNDFIKIYNVKAFNRIFVETFFDKYEKYATNPVDFPVELEEKISLLSKIVIESRGKYSENEIVSFLSGKYVKNTASYKNADDVFDDFGMTNGMWR